MKTQMQKSKWKLVYDEKLKGEKCPYQVYCNDKIIPAVFLDGGKRNGDKIEFSIYCDSKMVGSLTQSQIEELPTDKIKFFSHEGRLNCCRIWATL